MENVCYCGDLAVIHGPDYCDRCGNFVSDSKTLKLCECQTSPFSVFQGSPYCDSCGRLVTDYRAAFAGNVCRRLYKIQKKSTVDPSETHCYTSLSEAEIRLVALDPGEYDQELQCALVNVRFDNLPPFEATSYTWADTQGLKDKSSHIVCGKGKRLIPITRNCEMLLRRIRLPHAKRLVWIDAICINQSSTEERNHQVRQMADIYRRASRVLVFVGEPSSNASLPFADSLFDYLSGNFLQYGGVVFDTEVPDWWPSLDKREVFCALMKQPWFKRIWVMQEYVLARRGYWVTGSATLNLNLLCSETPRWLKLDVSRQIPPFLKLRLASQSKLRLADLLQISCGFQCEDPRDRVYALRGLASDIPPDKLIPDYSKTVNQVYTDVAAFLVQDQQSPNVLFLREPSPCSERASWIPDLASDASVDNHINIDHDKAFQTLGSLASIHYSMEKATHPILKVYGARMGLIERLGHIDSHSDLLSLLDTSNSPRTRYGMTFSEIVDSFDWLICLQGDKLLSNRPQLRSFIWAARSKAPIPLRSLLAALARCLHYRISWCSTVEREHIQPGLFSLYIPIPPEPELEMDGSCTKIFNKLEDVLADRGLIGLTDAQRDNLRSWRGAVEPTRLGSENIEKRVWQDRNIGKIFGSALPATVRLHGFPFCPSMTPSWKKDICFDVEKIFGRNNELRGSTTGAKCNECLQQMTWFKSTTHERADGRRLFLTEDSIGIGPLDCQPEDMIFSVVGARHLVVLRPGEDGYRFVGPCWLLETQPLHPQRNRLHRVEDGFKVKIRGIKGCGWKREEVEFQEISIC